MNIFDTHCHYNMDPLFKDWQDHWQKAQDHGVIGSIIVGTEIETTRRAIEIAKTDKNLFAAAGIHPTRYSDILEADLPTSLTHQQSVLSKLITSYPEKIVAIGETGLDYYRTKDDQRDVVAKKQIAGLKMHIAIANQHELPLIVHVRDTNIKAKQLEPTDAFGSNAYWDALTVIEQFLDSDLAFILHCISGPSPYLEKALSMGAYIGVAGNVTYPNADAIRSLVLSTPPERIFLETDAPFLAPQEFRGKQCEPWMIFSTANYCKEEFSLASHVPPFLKHRLDDV